jgi:hypothetical protein
LNPNVTNNAGEYLASNAARAFGQPIFTRAGANPFFAALVKNERMNVNRVKVVEKGRSRIARIPINAEGFEEVTLDRMYRDQPNRPPGDWPDYLTADDFTGAEYPLAMFELPLAIPYDVAQHAGPGSEYLDQVDQGIMALKERHLELAATQASSFQAPAQNRLAGFRHFLSATNTVGGINQNTNPWWQAQVKLDWSGAFTFPDLAAQLNQHRRVGKNRMNSIGADMAVFGLPVGGVDLWAKLKDAVNEAHRIHDPVMYQEYGVSNWMYEGLTAFCDFDAGQVDVNLINSSSWHLLGDLEPKVLGPRPIPGSSDSEMIFMGYHQLFCDNPRANRRIAGSFS